MSAPAPTIPQSGNSIGSDLVNIFFSPSKVFAGFRQGVTWMQILVAFLILSAGSYIMSFAVAKKVGFEQVAKFQMNANPKQAERIAQMPPDQQARQLEISTKISQGISYTIPLIMALIFTIYTLVLLGTFNFGFGQELKFKTLFATVWWAHLPGFFHPILGAISLFAGADPEAFNVQNPVATNFGFLINMQEHPALYALGSSIDLFQFWSMILVALGISLISKVKFSTAFFVVTAIFLLRVGITVLFASL